MKRVYLTLLFTGFIIYVYSQDKFIDRFTVRQSFQSKNDRAEPALFTFAKPKDKDQSWLLNAAIGYNLLKKSNSVLTIDPYFQVNKNTLIDKIQNNWQAGVSSEWQCRDMSKRNWSPIIIAAIKYNEDISKQITSFQGSIYFTPLFKGKAKRPKYFWIPNNTSDFGNVIQFTYSPYLGFENENRLKTESESSLGAIYRAVFRVTSIISLFPKSDQLKGKFEFNFDWQFRNNISESVDDLTKSDHKYFTTSFNYTFFNADDGKKSAKIGIDFTNGENPAKNFEQQSFYSISLKVKL